MNFINKLILMIAILLLCGLTANANQQLCDLEPPKNTVECVSASADAEVQRTCCLVHHNNNGEPCTELWCHTPDQCSWELLVPPVCG